MARCLKKTDFGRCAQPTKGGLCSAHDHWGRFGVTPDRYMEEKIVKCLKEPQFDWISDAEAHAIINGRYRGDGRRIDQWTVPEGPMEIDVEAWL